MSSKKKGVTDVAIPTAELKAGVVYYNIWACMEGAQWKASKRYSEFLGLHEALHNVGIFVPDSVKIPPKKPKLFVAHSDTGFIEERRVLLENYLKRIMETKGVPTCAPLTEFLGDTQLDQQHYRKPSREVLMMNDAPDDVEITGVSIPTTRVMSDHILYRVDVVNIRKRKTFSKWTMMKRFGQFYEMDAMMREEFKDVPSVLEQLPPTPQRRAKLLNDHMSDGFIEERRVLLENYLNKLIRVMPVVRHKDFLSFLGVSA